MASRPVPMLCVYLVRKGQEARFRRLLERHWPTLAAQGLVAGEPSRILRSRGEDGRTRFVEEFSWKDARASELAHASPAVMAVWDPMGRLAEGMEFWEVEPVAMPFAGAARASAAKERVAPPRKTVPRPPSPARKARRRAT